jgi:hypothetical protein
VFATPLVMGMTAPKAACRIAHRYTRGGGKVSQLNPSHIGAGIDEMIVTCDRVSRLVLPVPALALVPKTCPNEVARTVLTWHD